MAYPIDPQQKTTITKTVQKSLRLFHIRNGQETFLFVKSTYEYTTLFCSIILSNFSSLLLIKHNYIVPCKFFSHLRLNWKRICHSQMLWNVFLCYFTCPEKVVLSRLLLMKNSCLSLRKKTCVQRIFHTWELIIYHRFVRLTKNIFTNIKNRSISKKMKNDFKI